MSDPLSELAFAVAIERAKAEAKIEVLEEMREKLQDDMGSIGDGLIFDKIAALRKELEG